MPNVQAPFQSFETLVVWTEAEVVAQFKRCSSQSLILDLTRRGLRPFEAAHQVATQCGASVEALLSDLPPIELPKSSAISVKHVGSWMDFELFGDSARIIADRVGALLEKTNIDRLLIMMPPHLDDLPRADGLMIASLINIKAESITLTFPQAIYPLPTDLGVHINAEILAPSILGDAHLPPGPVTELLAKKLVMLGVDIGPLVASADGSQFIVPCKRFEDPSLIPDMVSIYAPQWGWDGLAFILNSADADTLARFAWAALRSRDADLAEYIANRAIAAPGDRSFAQSTLATILIINQSFEKLAKVSTDSGDLNRAWGEALAGSADMATEAFGNANVKPNDVMALYLKNISALAQFRVGNVNVAWATQNTIRGVLDNMDSPAPHLRFVNNLNMGRLARAGGELATAKDLITKAFDARGPHISEHDLFYREVLLADTASTSKDRKAYWNSAATIFMAQHHPGAIPMRAFRKVVSRSPRVFEARELAVAEAINQKLRSAEVAA